jgi:hypothetical protein
MQQGTKFETLFLWWVLNKGSSCGSPEQKVETLFGFAVSCFCALCVQPTFTMALPLHGDLNLIFGHAVEPKHYATSTNKPTQRKSVLGKRRASVGKYQPPYNDHPFLHGTGYGVALSQLPPRRVALPDALCVQARQLPPVEARDTGVFGSGEIEVDSLSPAPLSHLNDVELTAHCVALLRGDSLLLYVMRFMLHHYNTATGDVFYGFGTLCERHEINMCPLGQDDDQDDDDEAERKCNCRVTPLRVPVWVGHYNVWLRVLQDTAPGLSAKGIYEQLTLCKLKRTLAPFVVSEDLRKHEVNSLKQLNGFDDMTSKDIRSHFALSAYLFRGMVLAFAQEADTLLDSRARVFASFRGMEDGWCQDDQINEYDLNGYNAWSLAHLLLNRLCRASLAPLFHKKPAKNGYRPSTPLMGVTQPAPVLQSLRGVWRWLGRELPVGLHHLTGGWIQGKMEAGAPVMTRKSLQSMMMKHGNQVLAQHVSVTASAQKLRNHIPVTTLTLLHALRDDSDIRHMEVVDVLQEGHGRPSVPITHDRTRQMMDRLFMNNNGCRKPQLGCPGGAQVERDPSQPRPKRLCERKKHSNMEYVRTREHAAIKAAVRHFRGFTPTEAKKHCHKLLPEQEKMIPTQIRTWPELHVVFVRIQQFYREMTQAVGKRKGDDASKEEPLSLFAMWNDSVTFMEELTDVDAVRTREAARIADEWKKHV